MNDAQQKEVKTALRNFLRAFENCDLTAMVRFFAPDCVSFDQVVASSAGQAVSDFTPYRQMRRNASADETPRARTFPRKIRGPPYHSLVAQDLLVQMLGDAAVATFHIEREGIAATDSRVREKDDGWRIVHLHASSVQVNG